MTWNLPEWLVKYWVTVNDANFNAHQTSLSQQLNLKSTHCFDICIFYIHFIFAQQIIEESEERLKTDQEIEDLLNIINTVLPQEEKQNPEPEEANVIEEEEMAWWSIRTIFSNIYRQIRVQREPMITS